MKTILYIEGNNDGTIGGSYYSLLYLLQGLDKSRYQPHVLFYQDHVLVPAYRAVTPFVYIEPWKASLDRPVGTVKDVVRWPYDLWMDVCVKQRAIGRMLDKVNPDLVHLNNSYAAMHEWVWACHRRGIKVIAHDRGVPGPPGWRTRWFVRWLDASISVSEACRENILRHGLPIKRARRIYNGLDLTSIAEPVGGAASDALKRELGLYRHKVIVGIVGNIDRWKGQHVVLQALDLVRDWVPAVHCLIVGQVVQGAEAYERELRAFVAEHGLDAYVTFTGFRKDSINVMGLLDIVIHASVEPEPFGRVILESMALGKPLIATALGGPTELVVHLKTGMLIPPEDPTALADAIRFFVENPSQGAQMGQWAKERLVREFSVERMVRETENLYQDIFDLHPEN